MVIGLKMIVLQLFNFFFNHQKGKAVGNLHVDHKKNIKELRGIHDKHAERLKSMEDHLAHITRLFESKEKHKSKLRISNIESTLAELKELVKNKH